MVCVEKDSCVENDDDSKTYYVTAIFKCNEFSGSLQGSSEGEEVDFFNIDNLPSPVLTSARGAVDYLRQLNTLSS
jgi:hypothetical protein